MKIVPHLFGILASRGPPAIRRTVFDRLGSIQETEMGSVMAEAGEKDDKNRRGPKVEN